MLVNFPIMTSDRYDGIEKRLKSSLKKAVSLIENEESKSFKKAMNKFRKTQYIHENMRTFLYDNHGEYLTNHFRKFTDENGESWKDMYVFLTTDKEVVIHELEKLYVEIDGSSWTSAYDCTGRVFFGACDFHELEDRIIVVQSGAYDV